jgi:hypothetical protein
LVAFACSRLNCARFLTLSLPHTFSHAQIFPLCFIASSFTLISVTFWVTSSPSLVTPHISMSRPVSVSIFVPLCLCPSLSLSVSLSLDYVIVIIHLFLRSLFIFAMTPCRH